MNIYVDMVGDLFHASHVNSLKNAKKLGDKLIVGIHSDKDTESYKHKPILTMEERAVVIESCRFVNKIILNAPIIITEEYINKHNIDLVIHAHYKEENEKYNFMYENAIKLNKFKRLDYHGEISTTEIIKRIRMRNI